MRVVDLSLVKPGMRLSRPACLDDMTLLAAGVTLTERHIDRLKSLGVSGVAVDESLETAIPADSGDAGGCVQSKQADESEAPAGPSENDRRLAAFHAQRLRRLEWLFRKHAADPWMDSVRGVLEAYHVKKLACLPGSGGDAR